MKKNNIKILLIIGIVLVIIFSLFKGHENNYENEDFLYAYNNVELGNNTTISKNITIYIAGEVNKPGVYTLEDGSRIEDAITIAGGLTEGANLSEVNLAYIMHDAEKIFIPDYSNQNMSVISSPESSSSYSSKININTADISKLEELPGVGPSLAQKIITYREKNGKFSSIDDLKNITGIGDKKFESLKEYIST